MFQDSVVALSEQISGKSPTKLTIGRSRLRPPPPEWTPERVKLLLELWPQTRIDRRQLAARLGTTVSAIAGKASRLNLPRRDGRPHIYKSAGASACRAAPAPDPEPAPAAKPVCVAPPPLPPTLQVSRARACCWPLPREGRAILYCEAPVTKGSSYCPAHRSLAYTQRA